MKNFGKKAGVSDGTLLAYACACNCIQCFCTTCNNCTSVDQAVGLQYMDTVNDTQNYSQLYGVLVMYG